MRRSISAAFPSRSWVFTWLSRQVSCRSQGVDSFAVLQVQLIYLALIQLSLSPAAVQQNSNTLNQILTPYVIICVRVLQDGTKVTFWKLQKFWKERECVCVCVCVCVCARARVCVCVCIYKYILYVYYIKSNLKLFLEWLIALCIIFITCMHFSPKSSCFFF